MIEPTHPTLPITRQCALVGISRSAFYGGPRIESTETLALMRAVDAQFMETPWYGSRQMARHLRRQGHAVGRKRVRRLMVRMGLAASISGRRRQCAIPRAFSVHIGSYPAAWKKFRHSCGVKPSMSRPMAPHRPGTERSAALRRRALSLEKAFSMGLKSGL